MLLYASTNLCHPSQSLLHAANTASEMLPRGLCACCALFRMRHYAVSSPAAIMVITRRVQPGVNANISAILHMTRLTKASHYIVVKYGNVCEQCSYNNIVFAVSVYCSIFTYCDTLMYGKLRGISVGVRNVRPVCWLKVYLNDVYQRVSRLYMYM